MTRRTDLSRRHLAERDLPGIGTALAGYALVLFVLVTEAERIDRPFGPRPSDIVPTGGIR